MRCPLCDHGSAQLLDWELESNAPNRNNSGQQIFNKDAEILIVD